MSARAPRILIACASFKGTLSSRQAGRALAQGLRRALPKATVEVLELADGGEGFVAALLRQLPGAKTLKAPCRGPLGERLHARFALLPPPGGRAKPRAVLEMAASSGLTLVPEDQRDPLRATTLGVGDQLRAALNAGVGEIWLGLGGSATNDGGAGMAQALGARLLDQDGFELPPGAEALERLARVEAFSLDRRLEACAITAACDVRNPLCGKQGASHVFGPQKGADPELVRRLDQNLRRWSRVLRRDLGMDVASVPGAGAAGGLGAGCLAFLKAKLKPGFELVWEALEADRRLRQADLVITGEGCLDRQTLMGKAPGGVAARAREAGVPCVAIGGVLETRAKPDLARCFDRMEVLAELAGSPEAARAEPETWLKRLATERGAQWLS